MKNFKKVISAVIALAMLISSFATVGASSFSDVADTAAYAEAVDVLYALDIVNGYEEDGAFTFKPEGTITRAEAATMIVGALAMTNDAKAAAGSSQFADVNEQAAWATGYVNVGVAQGFIKGMGDGTFAPMDQVTYAQMCVMLTTITGYGDYAGKQGGYPTGYTTMAAATGINKGVNVGNDTALTRGQVAQMLYNALVTPMLGIKTYSIVGNEYAPLDGDGVEFKTLLSSKFGGYVATVAIDQTPDLMANGKNDEVRFDVIKADFWPAADSKVVDADTGVDVDDQKTYFAEGVNVNGNLLQSGKAVFVENEDEDLVMIYFAPNGKIDTLEIDAEEYILQSDLSAARKFYMTSAADKNTKLAFDSQSPRMVEDGIDIYVNGNAFVTDLLPEAAPTATNQNKLDNILGNAKGTITLVKETGKDYYSAIFVDYYQVAKVVAVEENDGQTVVTLTGTKGAITGGNTYSEIIVDDEAIAEGKVAIEVTRNNEAIELKDLVRGEIIAYATDFSKVALDNPSSIKIIATNDGLTGKVTSIDDTDYYVDGKAYKKHSGVSLTMGETYKAILDPFGVIYSAETDGTAVSYALAIKVASTEESISVVLADGTKKSLPIADDCDIMINTVGGKTVTELNTYLGTAAAQARVMTYKLNKDGAIKDIEIVAPTTDAAATYKTRTARLGSKAISETTAVINGTKASASAAEAAKQANYVAFAPASFTDGTVYAAHTWGTATYTSFVLLTSIGTKYNADSRFAVIKKGPVLEDLDGETVEAVEVLYEGKVQKLYFEENLYASDLDPVNPGAQSLNVGDAIFFDTDSYGIVNKVFRVLDVAAPAAPRFIPVNSGSANDYEGLISTDLSTGEDAWTNHLWDSNAGSIQFVEGYITAVSEKTIALAQVKRANDQYHTGVIGNITALDTRLDIQDAYNADMDDNSTQDTFYYNGVAVFGFADDCVAYEYDAFNDNIVGVTGKIKAKDAASIKASIFDVFEVANQPGNYAGTGSQIIDKANYAMAMIVDGAVVAIYAISK